MVSKLPRRWFRISGLNRFGLFDGISRWFAADSKCGPEPELLAPAPTKHMIENLLFRNEEELPWSVDKTKIKNKWKLSIPPTTAALGLVAICCAGAPLPASLRFCFEFDVAIEGCWNLSEAEN